MSKDKDVMAEKKNHLKFTLKIVLLSIGFVLLQFLMSVMDNRFPVLKVINGGLMALQFVLCFIMLKMDYKKGGKVALILMYINLVYLLLIFIFKTRTSFPGICNLLIYLLTLQALKKQFHIRHMEAVTDYLTGLYNRRGLYQLINETIAAEKTFYVVYIDLGNFKIVNDTYGHTYGDEMLKIVTQRMTTVLNGRGTATRIGGDEFVIIVDGDAEVKEITEEIIAEVNKKISFTLNNVNVDYFLTAYAGISKYPYDGDNADDLIKFADIAMYSASKDKAFKVNTFDVVMAADIAKQSDLERQIKENLENESIYMMYQPQYDSASKKIRGFEALLRMKNDKGRIENTENLISIAEKSELILQIDDYVLKHTMLQFKDQVLSHPDLRISVNISSKNIGRYGFVEKVQSLLEETGFPAANLEIEITEHCFVHSVDITIENVSKLKELGIFVSLDDFGTGYTSISHFHKMPLNLLKIDKSLIDGITTDEKNRNFVTTVLSIGHLMNCKVLAEGVENETQLGILKEEKFDYIQGFVLSKPLDFQDAVQLL